MLIELTIRLGFDDMLRCSFLHRPYAHASNIVCVPSDICTPAHLIRHRKAEI